MDSADLNAMADELECEAKRLRGLAEKMKIPSLSIDDMELSHRAWRVLSDMGCKTIDDVARLGAHEIWRARGAGRKTLVDVRGALSEHGRHLAGERLVGVGHEESNGR